MAERRKSLVWLSLMAWLLVGRAASAGEPLPDADFLEYLGSWEESDRDWTLLAEAGRDGQQSQGNADDETRQENERHEQTD